MGTWLAEEWVRRLQRLRLKVLIKGDGQLGGALLPSHTRMKDL